MLMKYPAAFTGSSIIGSLEPFTAIYRKESNLCARVKRKTIILFLLDIYRLKSIERSVEEG
jgi:hypothetical protein